MANKKSKKDRDSNISILKLIYVFLAKDIIAFFLRKLNLVPSYGLSKIGDIITRKG